MKSILKFFYIATNETNFDQKNSAQNAYKYFVTNNCDGFYNVFCGVFYFLTNEIHFEIRTFLHPMSYFDHPIINVTLLRQSMNQITRFSDIC